MNPVSNREFFDIIFGGLDGHLCITTIDRSKGKVLKQTWFQYPDDLDDVLVFIEKNKSQVDLYFCPHLFTRAKRKKEYVVETPVAWADGDDCDPTALVVPPTILLRTSEGRHSYFWKFVETQAPEVGESISKRIAYYHANDGMDQGGWDLTQLLRLPNTYNHKYDPPQIISAAFADREQRYHLSDFSPYPDVEMTKVEEGWEEVELPDESPKEIFDRYKMQINPRAFDLHEEKPIKDWSKRLWELETILFEAGMTPEEVYVVADQAACNKYRRDNRPPAFLWREVKRAEQHVAKRKVDPPDYEDDVAYEVRPPELLTDEQRNLVEQDRTFVEEYTDWASTLGDAAPQYHPAGAFVILSSILSGAVQLPTSFGTLIPNMWFMILADTTLTRKSTAMDNAVDLLLDVDYDTLLATDGSMEGLLTALASRPSRPSLFLRDEFTGLIEAMGKKDYMAGMMESLTKLYDGKTMKRILRSETIDVRNPVLILFAGGIRTKMMELLDYKHVSSGFLPRFVFITAESDITRLKPIGPPTTANLKERDDLYKAIVKMHKHYAVPSTNASGTAVHVPKAWNAELEDDAWVLYNGFEVKMLDFAMKSHDPALLTPMMDRLSKSGLKAAVLLAASRIHKDKVKVTTLDVLHAFKYIEQWIKHTAYIVSNIGTSQDEQKLQKILSQIESQPGVIRSKIMQRNYLTARDADGIFATLEQRGAIRREGRGGRGERLWPVS